MEGKVVVQLVVTAVIASLRLSQPSIMETMSPAAPLFDFPVR
jgi:hypothetical protein